jgi:hypothetical protein
MERTPRNWCKKSIKDERHFNLLSIAHELKYPFIEDLKNKLTTHELAAWIDYLNIVRAENPKEALDEYMMPEVDDLGKQFIRAMNKVNSKR